MATQPLDASREARATLRTVVQDHGTAALSNPQLMNSLLQDLMPGSPRESRVLVAAADADVAGILMERAKQHVSMAAAVLQAATALEERTALAPDACQWAARQMAEALNLPQETAPEPGPQPVPRPPPPRPRPDPVPPPAHQPARKPASAAIVAAWAALVCALSIPLQLLANVPLGAAYGWLIALSGLMLFSAAVLTFGGKSKYAGAGLIFGTALAMAPNFVEQSVSTEFGGWFTAASVLTTLTALAAAASSGIYFAREARKGPANLSRPLVAAFCAAGIGYTVAIISGQVQGLTDRGWLTGTGVLGSGVHGRFVLAGLVGLVAVTVPTVVAGLLASGTGVRVGVMTGWLVAGGARQLESTLVSARAGVRPSSGLYFSWTFWVIALALGVAMLVSDRVHRVSSVQAPVP